MPTYKLTATISHKSINPSIVHEFYYTGASKDDVLEQIDTLDFHKHNLDKHGKTAFKSKDGVKHAWQLQLMKDMN